jgi:hypothetical protein
MKKLLALALVVAFAAACAPGQAKRWFSPGHNKGDDTALTR